MLDPNTPSGFAKIRSLQDTGKVLGSDIGAVIGQSQFCLGYHIRHFLQSEHQPVALVSSEPQTAEAVFRRNATLGLHTVNHVVDSLYPFEVTSSHGLAIVLKIRFVSTPTKRIAEPLQVFTGRDSGEELARNALIGWDVRSLRVQASSVTEILNVPQDDLGLPESLFSNLGDPSHLTTKFYNGFLPGTHRLCTYLGIPPSFLAYRSILAAIYQLGTYAAVFGSETNVIVLRQADPLGFATGVTTITRRSIRPANFAAVLEALQLQNDRLKEREDASDHGYYNLTTYRGLTFADREHRSIKIPNEVVNVLERLLPHVENERRAKLDYFNDPALFKQTIESFLRLCALFCDERFEGADLQFGIVLGNPFLMKFWPGEMPVPVAHKDGHRCRFFYSPDVSKQIHLLENPAERCLVVPFQSHAGYSIPLAGYLIDLKDFQEAMVSPSPGNWISKFAPYVYATRRYPWAVAAVVGPHSEMRVFAGGRLVSYRDGKGWGILRTPKEVIDADPQSTYFAALGPTEKTHQHILQALGELALQISPVARPGSHGGLLVYSPLPYDDPKWNACDSFEQLVSAEPQRLDGERNWITGLALLNPDGSLNEAVAHLAVRASVLDGAIVFAGERGIVRSFATRLNFGRAESATAKIAGGTKRRTAESFVKEFSAGTPGAVAIAISADGPIRLTFYSPDQKTAVTRDLLDL
ncbi:MAG TPA: hypothetical protein VF006_26510 [Longimicrobium sp.]